ncbi:hypothetical protein Ciccas_000849 [Cichlidogyrus casuarinus]|uniref:Lengsin n=1 Tax=Cichlidogyrus casuarinus TaxID=1844966 RepID=A0ABD2QPP7_9PLAT
MNEKLASVVPLGSVQSVSDQVDQERIKNSFDYLRLSFCDLNGLHLSKLISTQNLGKLLKNSCEIYSGVFTFGPRNEIVNIPEIVEKRHANGFMKPDWSTLHSLPWAGSLPDHVSVPAKRIGSVLCEIHWIEGPVIDTMPRHVAKLMLNRLMERHKLKVYSAFEPEFRVFTPESVVDACLNRINPTDTSTLPAPFTLGTDMYKTDLLSIYERFFLTLDHYLRSLGINIQDFCTENGEGQLETPVMPLYGLQSADVYFILKQAIKEIAPQCGLFASFMPKPLANMCSSGCHYNHSLWRVDDNKNAFYDANAENRLSETARHWLGGLLEHLPAILALCSPTVNCYRRLHRHLAPSLVNWDLDDRFTSIRVKNVDESRTYIENRLASSAGGPYHVLAVTLAAGMDGLERKLEPPPRGIKDPEIAKKLPESLPDALECLRNDHHLVNILGARFVDWFIQVKERGDLATMPNAKEMMKEEETVETLAKERYEYFKYT